MNLTVKSVEHAKPRQARYEIPDSLISGLYLVVQPSGKRSWAIRYRNQQGKPRKFTIGPYPLFELGEARDRAREELQKVAKGVDPAAEKKAAKHAPPPEGDLMKNVIADFVLRHPMSGRYKSEVERMLDSKVRPLWAERRVQDIKRRDVVELLDGLVDAGMGAGANRIYAALNKMFNWAVGRGLIESSPMAGVAKPAEEKPRDRMLSDDEIRLFWDATGKLGYPFGPMYRLLLLLGARRSEVGLAQWKDVDIKQRLLTLRLEMTKNDESHAWPLSDQALAIIETLPRIKGSPWLFSTNGESASSGYSRAKQRLDTLMLKAARDETPDAKIEPWRIHDLRRTMASGMARLGVPLPVVEKTIGHTSGSFAGVVGIYQMHDFMDERREALQKWADFAVQN